MKSSNIPARAPARESIREADYSQLDLDEQAQRRKADDLQEFKERQRKRQVRRLIEEIRQDALDLMALKDCGNELLNEARIFVRATELSQKTALIIERTQAAYDASLADWKAKRKPAEAACPRR